MTPYQHSSYSGFGRPVTKTVKNLIIINIAVFVLAGLFKGFPWAALLGLVPAKVFAGLRVWQLATYMFVHLSLGHLLINMLMLYFFGPAIEAAWGEKEFLKFYFFTGIGAGLCSWLAAFNSFIPVVGASGAIFGLLVAYAIMFPQTVILLLFIFPMKIRPAVILLAGINLLGAMSQSSSGIAYAAHLAGGLLGYIYLKYDLFRFNLNSWVTRRQRRKRQITKQRLDEKIDRILDKVSKQGIKSLSKQQRKILERKSGKK